MVGWVGEKTYQGGEGAGDRGGNQEDLGGLVSPEEIIAGTGGEEGQEVGDRDLLRGEVGGWVGGR